MSYIRAPIVQAFDWIGLLSIASCTAVLAFKLVYFKPPANTEAGKKTLYYFGYNEKGMLSLYVNLFAACAYFAKMASHVSGDNLDDAPYSLVMYTYGDYMVTCPLLTLDLLWTLNLPYKFTYALFVFLTLFSGFISSGHPQPGRWMWFIYGMVMFTFTWLRIVGLVQVRFLQYFAKKEKSSQPDRNKRQSISSKAGFRQKQVRNPLQFALYVYFTIWMIYPLLWLLLEGKMISNIVNHCCTVMMDVLAKSMYGFALLRFQLLIDKSQVEFTQLKVTKAELQEELMEEKKKIRKIIKKQEEEEMAARGHDDDEDEDAWPAHMTTTRFSQGFSPGSSARQSPQQQPSFAMGQVPQLGADPLRSMNSSNGNINMMPSNSPLINGQGGRRPSPQMGSNDGGAGVTTPARGWRDL